ncbi:IspD/TarI family cytidylyltransferase [Lachnospiraceae bacterium 62-35]
MNIALILSGGTGTRLGSRVPKQYIKAGGKPIISYCIETLWAHKEIDAIQIVADPLWQEQILGWMENFNPAGESKKWKGFSLPGENRQFSIWNGLKDIRAYAKDSDYVLIHDGARPLLSKELITGCLEGAKGHDGAMPVLPMKDTVYSSKNGKKVEALLDRSEIYAGQAPEIFCLGAYYEANKRLLPERILKINGATEPAIMAGMDIAMIPGDENNFKITTKADLERFCSIVEKDPAFNETAL